MITEYNDTDTKTKTKTKTKTIISELNANAEFGFNKSIDVLFNDIINLLKHQTAAGFRVCSYNKRWSEFGTMMSPIHIGYTGVVQNNMMLSEYELARLLDAICEKLTAEQINVAKCQAKYITSNNVNYTLAFEIDLDVPRLVIDETNESITSRQSLSPSHSPDTHEYDFRCGSC